MLIDILENKVTEKKCLDKGFVKLIDAMPRLVPKERPTLDPDFWYKRAASILRQIYIRKQIFCFSDAS